MPPRAGMPTAHMGGWHATHMHPLARPCTAFSYSGVPHVLTTSQQRACYKQGIENDWRHLSAALCQVSPMPTSALRRTAKAPSAQRSPSPPETALQAKRKAIAKAQAVAPDVPVHLGSTPATTFRGDPDLFGRLVQDHDRHRALLAMIGETVGASTQRKKLFKELTLELKSHAAAEEQALWSTVMRNPATTDDARHAVSEHKSIDDMLADLAARDMASPTWMRRFATLRDAYLHPIREEEQEQFVAAQKHLSPTDVRYLQQVFNRRKKEEKARTKIEKKIKLKK